MHAVKCIDNVRRRLELDMVRNLPEQIDQSDGCDNGQQCENRCFQSLFYHSPIFEGKGPANGLVWPAS